MFGAEFEELGGEAGLKVLVEQGKLSGVSLHALPQGFQFASERVVDGYRLRRSFFRC